MKGTEVLVRWAFAAVLLGLSVALGTPPKRDLSWTPQTISRLFAVVAIVLAMIGTVVWLGGLLRRRGKHGPS